MAAPAAGERSVDVAAIVNVPHRRLVMALDPIPSAPDAYKMHPPPPGFVVRTFRPEDADAERQNWVDVELSAGEFTDGSPDKRVSDAIARFNEEFLPYVFVRPSACTK